MDRRDLWVHRIVAAAVIVALVVVGLDRGAAAALALALTSGTPVAILTWADRRFYRSP